MTSKKILTWLLIIITLGSLFFHFHVSKNPSLMFNHSESEYPDAYVTDINALQMNEDGLPDARLESPLLVHYLKENAIDITTPLVTFYVVDQPPWQVKADKGKALDNAKIIYLWDNVKVHQNGDPTHPFTTLLTKEATLYPEDKIAETNQFVTVERPGLHVQSVGARANMKTREVTLYSKAKAFYVSSNSK